MQVEWDDLPKELQLDDHEVLPCAGLIALDVRQMYPRYDIRLLVLQALLIQAWVRTGFWVADAARKHLSIAVASKEEVVYCHQTLSSMCTHCVIFPAQIWRKSGRLLIFGYLQVPNNALNTLEVTDGRQSSLHVPEDGPSTSASNVEDSRDSVVLSLRLRKGKVRIDNRSKHIVINFTL